MAAESAVTVPAATSSGAAPFQMRGASFTLLTLKVLSPPDPVFWERLAAAVSLAPGFYRHAPVVLDLSELADQPVCDLAGMVAGLRKLALLPVGVTGVSGAWDAAVQAEHLPNFPSGRAADPTNSRQSATAKAEDTNAPAQIPAKARATPAGGGAGKVVAGPVRSGQQHYSAHGDLVVTAAVSNGAELLADGNIHVYGALRGRALAGLSGDTEARIFCRSLEAELIAIAGNYQVREQFGDDYQGKAVQIRLVGDKIVIEPV